MKLLNLLLLSVCLASFPLGTGMTCKPSGQRISYNTLYSVGLSVNTAYSGYLDQVVAGKLGLEQVKKVSTIYNQFQSAFGAAEAAAQFNSSAAAPQNVIDMANSLTSLIAQVKGGAK